MSNTEEIKNKMTKEMKRNFAAIQRCSSELTHQMNSVNEAITEGRWSEPLLDIEQGHIARKFANFTFLMAKQKQLQDTLSILEYYEEKQ